MEVLVLSSDTIEVSLLPELGGRVLGIRAHGRELLRRAPSLAELKRDPLYWGSYPLVPWCNRIPDGRLAFEAVEHTLDLNFPGHTIHGRGWSRAWQVVAPGRLELADPGDAHFPWPYRAWQQFHVDGDEIRLELGLENTGSTRMPAGLGIHPWFDAVEGLEVRLPAALVYPADDGVPQPGGPVPVEGAQDLRVLATPAWGLDNVWTGVTERRVEVSWPTWGLSASYEFSAECDHVVLAAIKNLDAVAIEPQTHTTDGHRRRESGEPGAIGILEPGAQLVVAYALVVRRQARSGPGHAALASAS